MPRSLLVACVLFLAAVFLRAAPEFAGILTAPGTELFVLADSDRGQVSQWLRTGQQFEGYRIVAYRAATETLVLVRNGETLQLPLRLAKPMPRPADPDEMMEIAAQEIARNDHWAAPIRYQGPHLFKGEWLVVAHHESEGRIETRVVIFTSAGALKSYLRP